MNWTYNPQDEFLTLKTTSIMKRILLILSIAAGLTIAGCGSENSGHSHDEEGAHSHEAEQQTHDEMDADHQHEAEENHDHAEGEEAHSRSDDETNAKYGEESETMLGLEETYDEVRKGVRLILSYNSKSSSFSGTIENTTQDALPPVRVVVQLSNGTDLGPTNPVNLDPGEDQAIQLDAAGETFDRWSTHSEMGQGDHSHGADGDHEHQN